MTTNGAKSPLRIVVGSDNAGHAYKSALKETLKKHAGVAQVMDVGVLDADDSTAYPHLAVDACKKIKSGEVSRYTFTHSCTCTCLCTPHMYTCGHIWTTHCGTSKRASATRLNM